MNIRNTASSSDGWNRPWMEDKEKDKLRQEIAIEKANNLGRFPANTILTYDETDLDEVCGGFPKDNKGNSNARYFYCAKASRRDRDEGLEEFYKVENYKLKENIPELIRKEIEKIICEKNIIQEEK